MRLFATCLLTIGLAVPLAGCGGGSKSDKPAASYRDRVARATELPEAYDRAKALTQIGRDQARAKDTLGAEDTLELAAQACDEIRDSGDKAGAFSLLARAHLQLSDRSSARKALDSARKAVDGIENLELKARRLSDVAEAFGSLDDVAGATDALELAEELTGQLKAPDGGEDLVGRTLVLGEMAVAYYGIGKQDEAERVTARILEIAGQMGTDRRRSEAIAGAALVYSEMENRSAADTTQTIVGCSLASRCEFPESSTTHGCHTR